MAKKYRRIAIILQNIGFVEFLSWFAIITLTDSQIVFWLGLIIFLALEGAYIVISLIFWRCDYCGKGFPLRRCSMDKAEHCPFCGKPLDSRK